MSPGMPSPIGTRPYSHAPQTSAQQMPTQMPGGGPVRQPSLGGVRMRRDSSNSLRQMSSSFPSSSTGPMAQNIQVQPSPSVYCSCCSAGESLDICRCSLPPIHYQTTLGRS